MLCIRFLHQKSDSAGTIIGHWIVEDIIWEIFLAIIIAIISGFVIGKYKEIIDVVCSNNV